ncbi:MAG: hypothetical protein A2521_06775 [Deltaproteobacteria bacterium RIFOXYD12_FULL_57_12]|nr:MAG: hypothetical protein A2521_06775 [Deltaproteobacteria bacterium RIFOXYD12_FULL_57_12]
MRKIRVLFLEDNPDDVELELYELRKGGFDVTHDVARNRQEFFEKIAPFAADIIIADYSLPDFTGIEAIHACRELKITAPVILITGMGNEQVAVDSLRDGATDYILKKNITGFAARVKRALDIWADQQTMETVKQEKGRLQHQLFQAQKMETVGRLAGGIAHDFNNMLTGIMGYTSLSLRTLADDSPIRNHLQIVLDVSRRASDLVKQLLMFSRKIPLELTKVDLNGLIRKNVDFIRRVVEETVEIRLDLQEDLPIIFSDEGQLTQLLINFAVNARDAMQGKGVLQFKTRRCLPNEQRQLNDRFAGVDQEYVCITITDTGCGIPAGEIDRIFDPFYTTKDVGKGTGLGLAIVYSIVTGHGGWVDVDSTPGHGASFKVYLPTRKASDPEQKGREREQKDDADLCPHISHTQETVLLVEDEAMLRDFSTDMLQSLGYRVVSARDGEEATAIYQQRHQEIDLVISDMIMPKMSGLEFFSKAKAMNSDVKFILVTGYCLEDMKGKVIRDMSAILMKPYTTEKIAALIRQVLDE